jgi:hypothetical protein
LAGINGCTAGQKREGDRRQEQTAAADGSSRRQQQTIFHFSFFIFHLSFRTEEDRQWKMTDDK